MCWQSASNPDACTKLLLDVLEPYGIDTLASGESDLLERARTAFFAIAWPDSWRDFYVRSGLIERDPLLEELTRRREPFTWSELRADKRLAQAGTATLVRAAELGWTEGLVVPMLRGSGRFVGIVSLAGRSAPFGPSDKSVIALLCVAFHERVRYLAPRCGFPLPPAGLTGREIQCLNAIASGCSDRMIAEKIGVSISTVKEYVDRARAKLKVKNRSEAVVIAAILGIISL